jgi:probable lipoprotein NlpC
VNANFLRNFFLTFIIILIFVPASSFAENGTNSPDTLLQKPNDSLFSHISNVLGVEVDSTSDINFLQYVTSWLGTPYRYGSSSRSGIDCSGFVTNVFNEIYNISLSRSSAAMINDVSKVKKDELQIGDILFFKIRKGRISHVGIYLGNGKFIHSSLSSGVRVDSLDHEYYRKRFYAGGRVEAVAMRHVEL